jgi:hypothetical protein
MELWALGGVGKCSCPVVCFRMLVWYLYGFTYLGFPCRVGWALLEDVTGLVGSSGC